MLPNTDRAVVSNRELGEYLLSDSHPFGRHKAVFFRRFGFVIQEQKVLESALIEHAAANAISRIEETQFGTKYIIDGPLTSPDGRNPRIRAIWFIEKNEDNPRFVTAYPLGGGEE